MEVMRLSALKRLLKQKCGSTVLLACVIVLGLILISGALMEYMRLMVIANGVRDALQASVISVSTGNYDETYNGLREGYSGGYNRSDDGWQETLDTGDIYTELDGLLGLNSSHIRFTGTEMEYALSGLSVDIINTPFAPEDPEAENKFTAEARINVEIPLSFGWGMLPPMQMTVKTTSGYVPKF